MDESVEKISTQMSTPMGRVDRGLISVAGQFFENVFMNEMGPRNFDGISHKCRHFVPHRETAVLCADKCMYSNVKRYEMDETKKRLIYSMSWYYAVRMIISFLQTKGGTAKTTLAKCLAYSKAFHKAFDSICLVELDPQGTILAWHSQRNNSKDEKVAVAPLYEREERQMVDVLEGLMDRYETLILDVPGESLGKFTTRFAASLSDLVLIPMRSSTNDEQSFVDHIYPILEQMLKADAGKKGSFHIVPTFVHPQSKADSIAGYFREVMPEEVGCLDALLPHRSVYENFSREGMNLHDYAKSVKSNARQHAQAQRAIQDIEQIAENVLRLLS